MLIILRCFGTGHEPLLLQGLKLTCKENEESVSGCSKTTHSAEKNPKNKNQTVGFGENTCDLEGKQMQKQCQVVLIAESAVHVQEKTTGSRGARTFY